jgi:hypothetical protein
MGFQVQAQVQDQEQVKGKVSHFKIPSTRSAKSPPRSAKSPDFEDTVQCSVINSILTSYFQYSINPLRKVS